MDAVLAAWRKAPLGARAYNVADDGSATRGEIVSWLAGRLGIAPPPFSGAAAPGRRRLTPDRIVDNSRIKAELGWRPRHPSFREGYSSLL